MQETAQRYHRKSRRIKMGQPVRLRPCDAAGGAFEEVGSTKNVSREGFYFVTKREMYHEGMRVVVTLPYHWPPQSGDKEHVGQVVRVEVLDDGQRGVAVQLLALVGAS